MFRSKLQGLAILIDKKSLLNNKFSENLLNLLFKGAIIKLEKLVVEYNGRK